jgi:hypothetical protein
VVRPRGPRDRRARARARARRVPRCARASTRRRAGAIQSEWTLRALRAEPPEPPPAGGESGDDPSDDETQREPAPGDEPDRATQDPADAPQPDDGAPARPRFAPTLGDDEVERWLSQIDDAATQALRAAAGSDDEPRASRQAAPAW